MRVQQSTLDRAFLNTGPLTLVEKPQPSFGILLLQVICRIRPPTADEKASGVPMALEALGEGEVGVKTSGRHGGGGGGASSWRSFTLDKALGPSTTQEEVFRQVRGRREETFVCVTGGGCIGKRNFIKPGTTVRVASL